MRIAISPEQQAQLAHLAAEECRAIDELARELFLRGLEQESHFLSSVQAGRVAATRGGFIDQTQVWDAVEEELRTQAG